MARHSKPVAPEEHAEDARRLAESMSSTLSDEERERAVEGAHLVSEGLTELCGDKMVASKVAMAFARLLDMLSQTPLQALSQTVEHTVVGYSMASGYLAGTYDLPPAKETPDDIVAKVKAKLAELGDDDTEIRVSQEEVPEVMAEAVKYL